MCVINLESCIIYWRVYLLSVTWILLSIASNKMIFSFWKVMASITMWITFLSLMKEEIGTSVYRIYKAKGRLESSVGQNWIAANIVCKSSSGSERSIFWSVSAHHHQIEGLQKAFFKCSLTALPRARYLLGSRTRNTKLYHFKDKNCTIYLWIWAYSQTRDRTVHLRTAAGHPPGTSASDDCRNVKVPSTGHGNYESTKDLQCIKGCQQGSLSWSSQVIVRSVWETNWGSPAAVPWVPWKCMTNHLRKSSLEQRYGQWCAQFHLFRDVQKCPHTHTAQTAAQKHWSANSLHFLTHIKFSPPVKTQLRHSNTETRGATMKTEHSSL